MCVELSYIFRPSTLVSLVDGIVVDDAWRHLPVYPNTHLPVLMVTWVLTVT